MQEEALKDEAIDKLSGRVLDCAVSAAQGREIIGWSSVMYIEGPTIHLDDEDEGDFNSWQPLVVNRWCDNPYEVREYDKPERIFNGIPVRNLEPLEFFSTDINAAMSLILTLKSFQIETGDLPDDDTVWVSLWDGDNSSVAFGARSDLPNIICRSYLKLRNRS